MTTKGPKGRPRVEQYESSSVALDRFFNAARAVPEAEVTLYDAYYDVEVTA